MNYFEHTFVSGYDKVCEKLNKPKQKLTISYRMNNFCSLERFSLLSNNEPVRNNCLKLII